MPWASFYALLDLMTQLRLTVSEKKLVRPVMQVTCLGVLIDTVEGTISIPPDKLRDITDAVRHWMVKDYATKHQLQSILGLLLYVHKCVKPARVFLNRMLDLPRSGHGQQKNCLTPDFKRDLDWFAKFLQAYNGVSLYDHRTIDVTLELDACLKGFGGHSGDCIYHLSIPRGFRNLTIVHLEMVNILLAIRTFKHQWATKRVLIKCDNEAVVTVLRSGKTRDPYLRTSGMQLQQLTLTYSTYTLGELIIKLQMSCQDGRALLSSICYTLTLKGQCGCLYHRICWS